MMKLSASGGIRVICTIVFFFAAFAVTGQEVLLSDQEAYYDTLALTGDAERSYLSFRTLSDSRPVLPEGDTGPWNGVKKAEQYSLGAIDTRIYGPDLFASYNSNAPLGQNDGLLWQGRGANMSLSAGVRFEGYGFEAILKPVIACSQNAAFDLASPAAAYANQPFTDKAGVWGYPGVTYIDAPQRFGDDAVYDWSWGDSEIRYSWKTLTVGFGTQSIWLGPARINPLIHSNNAPPYPKFD
ncbi:MAG: capsule assembly Wzi family protein, partial [Treponema sp.]|nr:capsule assembly Wzi family protein [Treponema sp.]